VATKFFIQFTYGKVLDSIILLQFACGKLLSLVESKSPLAPLREHILPFFES